MGIGIANTGKILAKIADCVINVSGAIEKTTNNINSNASLGFEFEKQHWVTCESEGFVNLKELIKDAKNINEKSFSGVNLQIIINILKTCQKMADARYKITVKPCFNKKLPDDIRFAVRARVMGRSPEANVKLAYWFCNHSVTKQNVDLDANGNMGGWLHISGGKSADLLITTISPGNITKLKAEFKLMVDGECVENLLLPIELQKDKIFIEDLKKLRKNLIKAAKDFAELNTRKELLEKINDTFGCWEED